MTGLGCSAAYFLVCLSYFFLILREDKCVICLYIWVNLGRELALSLFVIQGCPDDGFIL